RPARPVPEAQLRIEPDPHVPNRSWRLCRNHLHAALLSDRAPHQCHLVWLLHPARAARDDGRRDSWRPARLAHWPLQVDSVGQSRIPDPRFVSDDSSHGLDSRLDDLGVASPARPWDWANDHYRNRDRSEPGSRTPHWRCYWFAWPLQSDRGGDG